MNSKDRQVLEKIYHHIASVLHYCKNCENLDSFQTDPMRVEACVFNLMQIGELAKVSLSSEFKEATAAIPWKQVYGMRNRIVHGYSGIDMRIIWDTIDQDLPLLKDSIENCLNNIKGNDSP